MPMTARVIRSERMAATVAALRAPLSNSERVSYFELMELSRDDACVEEACPVARAVEVLDGRWTMLVIRDLLRGTRRFSELRASLAGISPKTLTDRLRTLEERGLVERVMYAEI